MMSNIAELKSKENPRGVIRTYSGQYVDLLNPDPETILIEDIGQALSRQIRYNGHIPYDYTVARHSVIMSYYVDPEHQWPMTAMEALLHDAGEAYVGDMVYPLKAAFPEFEKIEDRITGIIMTKWNNRIQVDSNGNYSKSDLVDSADYEIYEHECHVFERPGRYIPKMQGATIRAMNDVGLGNLKVTGMQGDFEAFMTRFYNLQEKING